MSSFPVARYGKSVVDDVASFTASSVDTITPSTTSVTPSYLTGLTLGESSTSDFVIITASDGSLWVKNVSGRTLNLIGSISLRTLQGVGSAANLFIWADTSDDDGDTYTHVPLSLRPISIANNGQGTASENGGINNFINGRCLRWAMYASAGGLVTLVAPTVTILGGISVGGVSVFWQLSEVK